MEPVAPVRQGVLCAVFKSGDQEACETSLRELERLLITAGGNAVAFFTQARPNPDNATYFGSGKLVELSALCAELGADIVVVDDELSPAQIKNMEDAISCEVIDRSMLILDIFALHARTAEGKLQVEIAQLKYTAPRLIGKGKDMSRLGGGIGTRGPGESKLEIDRRRIRERIAALEAELEKLEKNRAVMRSQRRKNGIKQCAIVGYTNAGKSTLLNALTEAGVLAEDKLFATLDPTTRQYTLPGGTVILLTDTVGFIHKLPHHLVRSFKSTLEEAALADVILILCDMSDPECLLHLGVTENIREEIGAREARKLYVVNKYDLCTDENLVSSVHMIAGLLKEETVFISAKTGYGLEDLALAVERLCRNGKRREFFLIPPENQNLISMIYRFGDDVHVSYTEEGIVADAIVDDQLGGKLAKYLQKNNGRNGERD